MATPILIEGVSYKKIVIGIDGYEFQLVPTDANGNVFSQVTIEADCTIAKANIYLPEIASLNGNWNTSIRIINTSGNQKIYAIASGSDLIGSLTNVNSVADVGSSLVLTPVSATEWSVVISA